MRIGNLLFVAAVATSLLLGNRSAVAQERTAEVILAEYEAAKPPPVDKERREDKQYMEKFLKERSEILLRRAALALELYEKFPKHEKAEKALVDRWRILNGNDQSKKVITETEKFLAANPNSETRPTALIARAQGYMYVEEKPDPVKALAAVEDYIKVKPQDERGGQLLMGIADLYKNEKQKLALLERIEKDYASTRVATIAKGIQRQIHSIGKPFELSFTDAISGKTVSTADLKGKVVVVDFWATWCGPCVAEMPNMKQLYAQYKDKGVEFVGISLDEPPSEGGLDKLKEYVAKNQIAWPQYYQGKGWDSEFSMSWGINGIPALFVVDSQGNLYSAEAHGKLDKMIPELIAKREGKTAMR